MPKLILILLLNIFYVSSITAQLPDIQIDRPDQTECPFIVPQGFIQVENGFNIEKTNTGQYIKMFPTTLFKYGVNQRFELRLITILQNTENEIDKKIKLNVSKIGMKINLLNEKGILPETSLIVHLSIDKSQNNNKTTLIPDFRFTCQHSLSKSFSLSYNFGAEWNAASIRPIWLYTITSGYSISKKVGSYLEVYGYKTIGSVTDHRIDGGFTYLINKNCITDISIGKGVINSNLNYYLSLGFSFRI